MSVKNLSLTAQQVGDALGVCETAASRKISAAEELLAGSMLLAAGRFSRSARPDRVRTALVERLRTVACIASRHPEELERWITRLSDESRTRR